MNKPPTILVTRPALQSEPLCGLLQAVGATALPFPLLDIVPDPLGLEKLAEQAAWADWLVFVSPSAADIAWPIVSQTQARLACVGQSTAKHLDQPSIYPPNGNDSAALLIEPGFTASAGQRVLIIRGHGGRTELLIGLRARGVKVRLAEIYRRVAMRPDWRAFDAAVDDGTLYAAYVTSVQIAELLFAQAGRRRRATLQSLKYCVPHVRIAGRLIQLGAQDITITREGNSATVAALCQRQ